MKFSLTFSKYLILLFASIYFQVDFALANSYNPSERQFVRDSSGVETGAVTWPEFRLTRDRLEIDGRSFNIYIAVHKAIPGRDGWKAGQTAVGFNMNVVAMLTRIYETNSGKILLDRFAEGSGFQLHIFDVGSEPVGGRAQLSRVNIPGYRASSPSAAQDRGMRTELGFDSTAGPGTSSNIGFRKDVVFEYQSNPSRALRFFAEELAHAHRASWGITPPNISGLEDYPVFPNISDNFSLSLHRVFEELEVAGAYPSRVNPDIISSYIPVLDELKAADPTVDFRGLGVGKYVGKSGPEWIDSIRFVERGLRFKLRKELAQKDQATALAALDQLSDWATQIVEVKSGDPKYVRAAKKLKTRIRLTKRKVEKVCPVAAP